MIIDDENKSIEIYKKILPIIDGYDRSSIMDALTLILTDVIIKNYNKNYDVQLAVNDLCDTLQKSLNFSCDLW